MQSGNIRSMVCARPRVLWVRRRRPAGISPGDTAEARLDPGLIALLESPLGAAFHAPYTVPVSLPATAALAVLAPSLRPDTSWGGRELEVQWTGAPGPDDPVLASARLEEFSERLARFAVEGRTSAGRPLFRGTLQMVAVRQGIPVGFRSPEEYLATRQWLSGGPANRGLACRAPRIIPLGRAAAVEVEVANPTAQPVSITLAGEEPFGAGLTFDSPRVTHLELSPGERRRVAFQVRADRPHAVNLGKPWEIVFSAGAENLRVSIEVPDPNPGRTFYLLTEDCETFDGGPLTGNYRGAEALGNHNNFMDPEDYRFQMIHKPARLNEIAERHGARWTHFYAATQRFAAQWAARQSPTGEWDRLIAEMDASVRAGSSLHEYAPHIHFDYEPDSSLPPQPRLVYDPATDGILPNDYYHPETNPTHCYHDWDGSARGISYIKTLGDWSALDTKAGSLRKTMLHLARLQANRRAPLVARTGSYDFGEAAEDQAISTQAYEANGLRGNSDAYRPGAAPTPGGQIFWCAARDRQQPIAGLRDARLAQFAITMDSGFPSAEEMNRWFAAEREASRGPGVHGILFTTHAMFFAGHPDPFRSLEGGAFEQLDRHLAWVRENHPDVEFSTATEALLEYLDYYTPLLEASTIPQLCGGDPARGQYEFPVRLLGRGIRVDEQHPATVRIAAPACFSPADLRELRVTQEGCEIARAVDFDPRHQPAVTVQLTSRAALRLEVVLRPEAVDAAQSWFSNAEFYDPPEPSAPDLLRLRPPAVEGDRIRFSADLVRLLMHPVAGHTEPLGRRIHPLGGFAIAAALHAAGAADALPVRLKLRWLKPVDLQSDFLAETHDGVIRLRDDSGDLVAVAQVVAQAFLPVSSSFPPAPPPNPQPLDVDAWQRDFARALATYRSQRAWQIMLAVRKIYAVLLRGTWRQRAALLTWLPRALLGRPSGLDEYDLEFPNPASYLKRDGDGPPTA